MILSPLTEKMSAKVQWPENVALKLSLPFYGTIVWESTSTKGTQNIPQIHRWMMPKGWHNTCKLAKCVKKSADLILSYQVSQVTEVTLCKIQRGCALRQTSNKHDLETPFKSQRCLLRMDVLSAEISLVKLRIVSLVFYWIANAAAAHSLYRKEYNASWSLFLKLLLIVALTGNRAWKFITFIHL